MKTDCKTCESQTEGDICAQCYPHIPIDFPLGMECEVVWKDDDPDSTQCEYIAFLAESHTDYERDYGVFAVLSLKEVDDLYNAITLHAKYYSPAHKDWKIDLSEPYEFIHE